MKMKRDDGFTIVELLVAMALSLVVMASIYSVYRAQQKSYVAQEQVTVMQQNLRSGMTMLTKDIRMAGYDPDKTLGAGMTVNNNDQLAFTRLKEDETGGETITYSLSGTDLVRAVDAGSPQVVAENIDAIDFVYLDASGVTTSSLTNVRSIQVSMVARTGKGDQGYVNSDSYQNQEGTEILSAQNDNIRRRLLTREIKCRNLGL